MQIPSIVALTIHFSPNEERGERGRREKKKNIIRTVMVDRSIFHGIFSRPSVIKLMEGCKNDFHGERYRVRLERVYK